MMKCVIGSLIFLLLCVGCARSNIVEPLMTDAPTVTVRPTHTAAPTNTQSPTATATKTTRLTRTIRPTDTPTPAATSDPSLEQLQAIIDLFNTADAAYEAGDFAAAITHYEQLFADRDRKLGLTYLYHIAAFRLVELNISQYQDEAAAQKWIDWIVGHPYHFDRSLLDAAERFLTTWRDTGNIESSCDAALHRTLLDADSVKYERSWWYNRSLLSSRYHNLMPSSELKVALASHHLFELCHQPTSLALQLFESKVNLKSADEQFEMFAQLIEQANQNGEPPYQIALTLRIFADVEIESADLNGDDNDEWIVRLLVQDGRSYEVKNRQAVFILQQGEIVYDSAQSTRLGATSHNSRLEYLIHDQTADGLVDVMLMGRLGRKSSPLYLDFVTSHGEGLRSAIEIPAVDQPLLWHRYGYGNHDELGLRQSADAILLERWARGATCTSVNHTTAFKWDGVVLRPSGRDVQQTGLRSETFHAALLAYDQGDLANAKALFYRVVTDETLYAAFPEAPCTFLTDMIGFSAFRLLLTARMEEDNATAEHWHNWLTKIKKRETVLPAIEAAADRLINNNDIANACHTIGRDLEKTFPNIEDRILFDDAIDIIALCQLPRELEDSPYTFSRLNLPIAAPQNTPTPYFTPTPTATYDRYANMTQTPRPTYPPTPTPVSYGSQLANIEARQIAEWVLEQRKQGKSVEYVRGALRTFVTVDLPTDDPDGYTMSIAFIFEHDLTGDGIPEWYVTIGKHWLSHLSDLFVLDETSIIYDVPNIEWGAKKLDFTGDGRDELWFHNIQNSNCNSESHKILSGHHGYLEMILATGSFGCGGDTIIERTYDGLPDLQRRAGGGPTNGTIAWCTLGLATIRIHSWDGHSMHGGYVHEELRLTELASLFPAAHNHFAGGRLLEAAEFYTRVMRHDGLSFAFSEAAYCPYDYIEQYTAVRLMLLYKLLGDEESANEWHEWLHDNFPDDDFTFAGDLLIDATAAELPERCDEVKSLFINSTQYSRENYVGMGDLLLPHTVCNLPNTQP